MHLTGLVHERCLEELSWSHQQACDHAAAVLLCGTAQAPGSSRDLLLLDIALESWLRLLVERQDKRSLSGDDLVELMALVLANAALTVNLRRGPRWWLCQRVCCC
jgi:hypothetical protein